MIVAGAEGNKSFDPGSRCLEFLIPVGYGVYLRGEEQVSQSPVHGYSWRGERIGGTGGAGRGHHRTARPLPKMTDAPVPGFAARAQRPHPRVRSGLLVRIPIGSGPSIERLQEVQAGRQTKRLTESAEGIRHGNVTVTGKRPREHVCDALLASTQVGHTQYLLKHQQGIRSHNASIPVDVTVGMTGLPGV